MKSQILVSAVSDSNSLNYQTIIHKNVDIVNTKLLKNVRINHNLILNTPMKFSAKIWNWLLYITNNEEESRHEQVFDMIFFLVNTIAAIVGVYLFIHYNEPQWIAVLIIEYTWAFDNMRNNRP